MAASAESSVFCWVKCVSSKLSGEKGEYSVDFTSKTCWSLKLNERERYLQSLSTVALKGLHIKRNLARKEKVDWIEKVYLVSIAWKSVSWSGVLVKRLRLRLTYDSVADSKAHLALSASVELSSGSSDSPRSSDDAQVTDICGPKLNEIGWSRSLLCWNSTSLSGSTCVKTIRSWTLRDFSLTRAVSSPRVILSCQDRDENRLLLLELSSVSCPNCLSSRNWGSGSVSESAASPAAAKASSRLRRAADTARR